MIASTDANDSAASAAYARGERTWRPRSRPTIAREARDWPSTSVASTATRRAAGAQRTRGGGEQSPRGDVVEVVQDAEDRHEVEVAQVVVERADVADAQVRPRAEALPGGRDVLTAVIDARRSARRRGSGSTSAVPQPRSSTRAAGCGRTYSRTSAGPRALAADQARPEVVDRRAPEDRAQAGRPLAAALTTSHGASRRSRARSEASLMPSHTGAAAGCRRRDR